MSLRVWFEAKKIKQGNSYTVIIPMGIARILHPEKEYRFEITEIGQEGVDQDVI